MENNFAYQDNPNLDVERETWSRCEDAAQLKSANLRGIVYVLFDLFKIASQRQASLREQNHELSKRLVLALLMQQLAVRSTRISQSLAIDPDECATVPQDSIMNDVATVETLAANLRMVLQHSNISSFRMRDNSNALGALDTVVRSSSSPYGSVDSILQPETRFANPPPPFQPGGLHFRSSEGLTSHDMPMPRFASFSSGQDVQEDPFNYALSL